MPTPDRPGPTLVERDLTHDEMARMRDRLATRRRDDTLLTRGQGRHSMIVEVGQQFIGCVSGLGQGDWFYITDIWLDPSFRNKDLGAPLLARLERSIIQTGRYKFYTWCTNDHAADFFQRQGYRPFCNLGSYTSPQTRQIGLRKFMPGAGMKGSTG